MTEDKYLTVSELAKSRRVSPDTIKRLIKSGSLKAEKVGKQWRIKESDWYAYLRDANR